MGYDWEEMDSVTVKLKRLYFEISVIGSTFRWLIMENVPIITAEIMFILFLIGFLVGTFALALVVKLIGGALKPTLPSVDAPVRKVVVRRRVVQTTGPAARVGAESVRAIPRPPQSGSRVSEEYLTT